MPNSDPFFLAPLNQQCQISIFLGIIALYVGIYNISTILNKRTLLYLFISKNTNINYGVWSCERVSSHDIVNSSSKFL